MTTLPEVGRATKKTATMAPMRVTASTDVPYEVGRVLVSAGLVRGRFQARGVHGEYYDPPVTGFKIDYVRTMVDMTPEEKRRQAERYYPGYPEWRVGGWDVRWVYVDHVGKGQKQAVQNYAAILRGHGIPATVQPAKSYAKKAVAVVEIPLHFYDYKPQMELVARRLRFAQWP